MISHLKFLTVMFIFFETYHMSSLIRRRFVCMIKCLANTSYLNASDKNTLDIFFTESFGQQYVWNACTVKSVKRHYRVVFLNLWNDSSVLYLQVDVLRWPTMFWMEHLYHHYAIDHWPRFALTDCKRTSLQQF